MSEKKGHLRVKEKAKHRDGLLENPTFKPSVTNVGRPEVLSKRIVVR